MTVVVTVVVYFGMLSFCVLAVVKVVNGELSSLQFIGSAGSTALERIVTRTTIAALAFCPPCSRATSIARSSGCLPMFQSSIAALSTMTSLPR